MERRKPGSRSAVFTVVLVIGVLAGCTGMFLDAQQCFEKGVELSKSRNPDKAYKYFEAAAKKENSNSRYHWMAALMAPNRNAAFIHAKASWENGNKNPSSLMFLSRVSFYTESKQRLNHVLTLYSELPDSFQTPEFKGQLYQSLGYHDSALVVWRKLLDQNPSPSLLVGIARAVMAQQGGDSARVFLEKYRRKGMLDGQGYASLASLYAFQYDYSTADSIWSEAKRLGLYDLQTEYRHLTYLTLRGHFADALKKALALSDTGATQTEINPARTIQSYVLYYLHDSSSVATLKRLAQGAPGWNARETQWAAVLHKTLRSKPGETLEEMKNVLETGIASSSLGMMAYARELARAGKHTEALEVYEQLPKEVALSPTGVADYAWLIASEGDIDKALAVISRMHAKRLFTKKSLEVFRDLTFRNQMIDKSLAAQRLLEQEYGKDVRVKFSGAMLALRTGKADSALGLLEGLHREYPDESRLEQAYLFALYNTGKYEKAIALCEKSTLPVSTRGVIKARSLRKLGKDQEAKRAYAQGLEKDTSTILTLEYANFLLEQGDEHDAMLQYDQLVKRHEENKTSDTAWSAIMYNNLAWTMLQSGGDAVSRARDVAEKAYELAPENPHVVDTYAEVLLQNERFLDCIDVLRKSKVTEGEPRLLEHLGRAYEMSRDVNNAVRFYKDALEKSKGEMALPMQRSKEELHRHVAQLIEKNK